MLIALGWKWKLNGCSIDFIQYFLEHFQLDHASGNTAIKTNVLDLVSESVSTKVDIQQKRKTQKIMSMNFDMGQKTPINKDDLMLDQMDK